MATKTVKAAEDYQVEKAGHDLFIEKYLKEKEKRAAGVEDKELEKERRKLKRKAMLSRITKFVGSMSGVTQKGALNQFRQRCPRCGSYKPVAGICPNCRYNPRTDFIG